MDVKKVNEQLNLYIRPQTFPLALRMCELPSEVPKKVRIPTKDLGMQIPTCQAIAMARRYGWTVAIGKEDISCPFGAVILGFVPAKKDFLNGSYWEEGLWPGSKEAAARSAQTVKKLENGKYSHLVVAPLDRADFEPHLVAIYGNSAQVMRLVQGALHGKGGALTSSAAGAVDCSDIIVQTMLSGECQFVLPGGGDRIWGLTQDTEMVFTMPMSKVEKTIEGLEATHRMGWRYPTPSFLRFQSQFAPAVTRLLDYLKRE